MPDARFYDDSSTALGISHSSVGEKRLAEKVAYLQEIGVANETELQRVIPKNIGAHDAPGRRMQKYINAGYSTLEAFAAAEQEAAEAAAQDILGDSIENLMDANKRVSGRSGGKGRTRKTVKPISGPERIERHLAGATPFDEGHTSGSHIGRPRLGREVRVVCAGRVEPKDAQTIEFSGVTAGSVLSAFAATIRMAKSGVERTMIADALLEIVDDATKPRKDVA